MAIDSQQKRMSACGAGRPFIRSNFPSASKDASWRISVGNAYAGVQAIFNKLVFDIRDAIFNRSDNRNTKFNKNETRIATFNKTDKRDGEF